MIVQLCYDKIKRKGEGIIKSKKKIERKLTYTQIIVLSFAALILIGTFLLALPISSRDGNWTEPLGALFTATSSTCVTGLVVFDTYTHWSSFGQAVILILIQIGGLGFMTVVSMVSIFLKRRIGLRERRLLMQSAGTMRLAGIVEIVRRVLFGTFMFEGAGALILATRFCPEMGLWKGIWNAVFHSISAFCNAGFDLMGSRAPFSSLTYYRDDITVNITVMLLIIIGGIGFFVWDDIREKRFNFKKYEIHTKVVLITSAALILLPAVLFFIFEFNGNLADLTFGKKWLASLFMSVTTRTAGMNTISIADLSESGKILTSVLMLIGGSPGSTAGGIKTTTVAVLLLGMIATARGNRSICIFKRRLDDSLWRQASSIFAIYIIVVISALLLLGAAEPLPLQDILLEVTSAAGTVGLSTGITPTLSAISKITLILLMFGGRVGCLSLVLVFAEKRQNVPLDMPVDKIMIG